MTRKTMTIAGQSVVCRLVRSRRRSIGLTIDQRGLTIGAPWTASAARIDAALKQHGAWVLEKLELWRVRQTERAARIPVEGNEIPWLGRLCRLSRVNDGYSRHLPTENRLEIAAAGSDDFLLALIRFFKQEALTLFASRVQYYAVLLDLTPPPCFLSSARKRWGSCNIKGEIRLSWRLLHLSPELVDYVVAHELAHLKEMNHSPRFWAVVERLYPDWRHARTKIRRLTSTLPQL